MADFAPTISQKAAIETKNGAVLVSAAAGSGKTRVLTERLMKYLTDADDPKDIDSFLVITFTKAAAAELRGRIMEDIGKALAANPENRRLRRQSAACQRAQIGTIHGFCQTILRENCHVLGLSPDFRVADEDRAAAMKETALNRVMEKRYEHMEDYPGFDLLADTVGSGRDDGRLTALVLAMHSRMQSHARPEKWAMEQVAALELEDVSDAGETPWGREIMTAAGKTAGYWAEEMEALVYKMAGCEKIRKAYSQSVEDTAVALRDFVRALEDGWDRAREFAKIPFPRLGSLRDSPDPELSEFIKSRRDACKKGVKALGEQFEEDSAKLLSDMRRTAPAMSSLLALVLDFDKAFSEDKRRASLVDFNDLEHLAARLLTNDNGSATKLAREISGRYTEIMVDEYQDVSRVQDTIFRAVSKDGKNLFMVGDVKQAIYRFRLADPTIFTEKYESYKSPEEAGEGQPKRILLRENFRSRREIINAANSVFSACMSKTLGEIDYDDAAALRLGASYDGAVPLPELVLVDSRGDLQDETPDKVRTEAAAVADKIHELMSAGTTVTDHGFQRPLRYGDIAILLRSANAVGGTYRQVLTAKGIPVLSGQGGGFFTSIEVSCVMSLLAVIDNPHQDVPLIALLRSPAFGFTPDELSQVRSQNKEGDFFDAVESSAHMEKCRNFIEKLSEFRDTAPDMELGGLIWMLYNELDLMAICSAMPDGEARRQNLLLLFEYAKKFETTGYRGVHRFVSWLQRLAARGDEPGAGTAGAQAVTIMSVHKSKGLEFPVVFLCDTSRRFNRQDSRETVLIHPALGLGPKVTDLDKHIEYPTLARQAIKQRAEREMLSEEMRLLYVALTRARERLIITAAVKDPQTVLEDLRPAVTSPMPPEVLMQAQSPSQWLIYAALGDGGETMTISCTHTPEDGENGEAVTASQDAVRADGELVSRLAERLSFVYPHRAAVTLPSKVTATELKDRLSPSDDEAGSVVPFLPKIFRRPKLGREAQKLTGAKKGTATHLALQYMDFESAAQPGGAEAETRRLRQLGVLSASEAEAVDTPAVEKLLNSPLGERMRSAHGLNREFRFSVLLPAEEFFPGGEGEEVLLQGAIDCWFEAPDGIVIVDYKTDRVEGQAVEERAKLYARQVRAYALAIKAATGKPVKEIALYFLHPGKVIAIK